MYAVLELSQKCSSCLVCTYFVPPRQPSECLGCIPQINESMPALCQTQSSDSAAHSQQDSVLQLFEYSMFIYLPRVWIEHTTSALQVHCSTTELQERIYKPKNNLCALHSSLTYYVIMLVLNRFLKPKNSGVKFLGNRNSFYEELVVCGGSGCTFANLPNHLRLLGSKCCASGCGGGAENTWYPSILVLLNNNVITVKIPQLSPKTTTFSVLEPSLVFAGRRFS